MTGFIVDCYALSAGARTNRHRLYDSVFLSRPKGTDKSGIGARVGLFEGFGPCRPILGADGGLVVAEGGEVYTDPFGLGFVYEYEPGEPMGQHVNQPLIRCMATEEGQTGNVYDSIYYNLSDEDAPLSQAMRRRDDAGLTRSLIPGGGQIVPSTAAAASKDGGLETHVCFDETHLYNTPELRRMYATVVRNLVKRKGTAGTWYLETTTMYAPGEESIAEGTYKVAQQIAEGKTKRDRLLLDHRWGEIAPEDMGDESKLRAALADSYGDALEWNDLDGLVDQVLDIRADTNDSIRYFLNDQAGAENAWLQPYEWTGAKAPEGVRVQPKDVVTLGFDGSRGRAKGVTDATALIGCRVSDGHVFQLDVWEQPKGVAGKGWEPPVAEINAAVAEAFKTYRVVGFYADPAKWESHVTAWEAAYGSKLKVKSSQKHPIFRWMTGQSAKATVDSLESFRNAVEKRELTHDGSPTLSRHVLAARRVSSRVGVQIAKEHPDSERKIDAAVAAVLAWQARLDAVAAGANGKDETKRTGYTARRLI